MALCDGIIIYSIFGAMFWGALLSGTNKWSLRIVYFILAGPIIWFVMALVIVIPIVMYPLIFWLDDI